MVRRVAMVADEEGKKMSRGGDVQHARCRLHLSMPSGTFRYEH